MDMTLNPFKNKRSGWYFGVPCFTSLVCLPGLACFGPLHGQDVPEDRPAKLAPLPRTVQDKGPLGQGTEAKAGAEVGIPAFPVPQLDPIDGYIKGLLAWKRAGLLESILHLESALRADPQALAIKQSLVPLYLTFERRNEAKALGLEVLAQRPDEYELALLVGRICRQLRQYEEAEKVLTQARNRSGLRELPALRVQILVELAHVADTSQKWSLAHSSLNEVATLLADPGSLSEGPYTPEQIVLQRAEVHEKLGKLGMKLAPPDPKQTLDPKQALDPKHTLDPKQAHDPKQIDLAMENFLQAGKLDPARMSRLALHLAEIMEAKQKFPEALLRVDEYLASKPQGSEGYELKIRLLEKLGKNGEVLEFLEEAHKGNRVNSGLALVLGKRLAKEGETTHAEDLFLKELTRPMGPAAARELLALWATQEMEGANKLLDKLEKAFGGADPTKFPTLESAMRPADPATVRSLFSGLRHEPQLTKRLFKATVKRLEGKVQPSEAIRFFLASYAVRVNDWKTAEALYASLAGGKLPSGVVGGDLATGWARAALMLGKTKEALEIATKLTPDLTGPLRVNLRLVAAEAHVRQGDLKAALGELAKAEAESELKDRFRCQLNRVWIFAMAGQEEQALTQGKTLLEGLVLPGDRKEAKRVLSAVLMMLERNDEALAMLRELLREDPNDPGIANDLGYLLVDLGRELDEGEKLVRKAIELDRMAMGEENPEKCSIVDSLGWAHFRRGRLGDALKELKRALELPGGIDNPVIFDHLGDVQWALGQDDDARKSWQSALKLYDNGIRPDRKNRVSDLKSKWERPAGEPRKITSPESAIK